MTAQAGFMRFVQVRAGMCRQRDTIPIAGAMSDSIPTT